MNETKPVVRWIIGPCHKVGFELLKYSIVKFKRIYGCQFKYILCFNQLNSSQINLLPQDLVDEIIDQRQYENSLDIPVPQPAAGTAWKLYPPRFFLNCHELIIDNDLIIYRKLPEIELFLKSKNICLVTEAYKRSYDGKFEHLVKKNFKINSGFVGLPPCFNYANKIKTVLRSINSSNLNWEGHFEEQSVVAAVLQNQNCTIVPLETIQVNGEEMGNKIGKCGTHFIGTNKGFDLFWNEYKKTILY